jgi:hypothetical protein
MNKSRILMDSLGMIQQLGRSFLPMVLRGFGFVPTKREGVSLISGVILEERQVFSLGIQQSPVQQKNPHGGLRIFAV